MLRSGLLRCILHTCPKLWCNPCSKCYAVDCCFGTCFTHVQSCDVTRVQSATQWTASVHTSHMSKAVMEPVFKVLRSGLLRWILHTCRKLWWNPCSKCYAVDCFGTYIAHRTMKADRWWKCGMHGSVWGWLGLPQVEPGKLGRKFQRRNTRSQRKNLLIECAQGDQPRWRWSPFKPLQAETSFQPPSALKPPSPSSPLEAFHSTTPYH